MSSRTIPTIDEETSNIELMDNPTATDYGDSIYEDSSSYEMEAQASDDEDSEPSTEESTDLDAKITNLESKLGLSDNETKDPNTETQQAEKSEQIPQEEVWFETQFEKRFGVKPEAALEAFNRLMQFQEVVQQSGGVETLAKAKIEREERMLQQEWGVDDAETQARLTAIREKFKSFSPEKQAALDNVDGARLVWAYIERDMKSQSSSTPQYQRSSRTSPQVRLSQPKKRYSVSQLANMSEAEYRSIDWGNLSPDDVDFNYNEL